MHWHYFAHFWARPHTHTHILHTDNRQFVGRHDSSCSFILALLHFSPHFIFHIPSFFRCFCCFGFVSWSYSPSCGVSECVWLPRPVCVASNTELLCVPVIHKKIVINKFIPESQMKIWIQITLHSTERYEEMFMVLAKYVCTENALALLRFYNINDNDNQAK